MNPTTTTPHPQDSSTAIACIPPPILRPGLSACTHCRSASCTDSLFSNPCPSPLAKNTRAATGTEACGAESTAPGTVHGDLVSPEPFHSRTEHPRASPCRHCTSFPTSDTPPQASEAAFSPLPPPSLSFLNPPAHHPRPASSRAPACSSDSPGLGRSRGRPQPRHGSLPPGSGRYRRALPPRAAPSPSPALPRARAGACQAERFTAGGRRVARSPTADGSSSNLSQPCSF